MLVKNWMSRPVITINTEDAMQDAMDLLEQHKIKMLPVMKKDNLVGIVTDRDFKRASASDATTLEIHELLYLLSKTRIEEIMTTNPITVPEDFTIEEAAEVILKNKISGLPVSNPEEQLVGIITQTDIFKVLISLTGVGKKGIQFAFLLKDQSGSIKTVADIIRKHAGRMVSILTSYERAPQGNRSVYIRMTDIDRNGLAKLKAEPKQSARLLYVVDHHQNQREIY